MHRDCAATAFLSGQINPGGPTESTFNKLAGQDFIKSAVIPAEAGTQPSPKPSTGNQALNAEITATKKQNAVADAQQTVIAGIGNETRSDYRKAQDRDRLEKAKDEAKAAKARAVDLENQRRKREQEQQLEQTQRANRVAEPRTAQSKQQLNKGLSTLAKKAGELTGNLIRNALEGQQGPQSVSNRQVGEGETNTSSFRRRPESRPADNWTPASAGVTTAGDGVTKKIELSGEAFQSNQRLATALSKRRGVGDLAIYTQDAITTDPKRVIPEIADLYNQVHANDPAQAKELIEKTTQGLDPDMAGTLRHTIARNEDQVPPSTLFAYRRDTPIEPTPLGADQVSNSPDTGSLSDGQGDETLEGGSGERDSQNLHDVLAQQPRYPDTSNFGAKADNKHSDEAIPSIPEDKKQWFKGKEKEWRDFYQATGDLSDISKAAQAAYMHIFAREGGLAKDPSSSAASGIIQRTADLYLGKGNLKHVKPGTPPSKLSIADRAKIYRHYMDDQFPAIGGHKVLDQVRDEKGAIALADGMFRLGRGKAAEGIQEAMRAIDSSQPKPDGKFGSKSLAAYKRLLADPKTRDRLLNAVADRFIAKAKGEHDRWGALRP